MTIKLIIKNLIQSLINGENIIFLDQNAPRPALPYWTIRISSQRKLGEDYYGNGVDNDGDQIVSGVREATVQIQRYGKNSDESCVDLRNVLSKITVLESWQKEKIALFKINDVLNVPYELDNSQLEPRASLDLFVRFGTDINDNVGEIAFVETNEEFS